MDIYSAAMMVYMQTKNKLENIPCIGDHGSINGLGYKPSTAMQDLGGDIQLAQSALTIVPVDDGDVLCACSAVVCCVLWCALCIAHTCSGHSRCVECHAVLVLFVPAAKYAEVLALLVVQGLLPCVKRCCGDVNTQMVGI